MNVYIDYPQNNFIYNIIDESKYKISTDFNDRRTHYLKLNKDQLDYFKLHPEENVHNVWFMINPEIPEDDSDSFTKLKEETLKEIEEYDKSINVNLFYVNEEGAWLDKNERVSIRNTINIVKESGANAFSIWINNKNYVACCDIIIDLLNKLEIYAMNCFNVTQQHIANINNSISEEYILTYNFKENYPNKLYFTL